nr:hypothetical protein BaRGS_018867 [Batillaria attramentaria]
MLFRRYFYMKELEAYVATLDAFEMPSGDGKEEVTITPPCAHTGPAPVQVRLISSQLREGQEQHMKSSKLSPSSRNSPQRAPRSHGLIVHCHGGGFVAQSSRSHEVYLRHWAKDLDVPILSIDYSLAPESPFPRALEECFYAYAWAVQNCDKLGSTGEVICLAGDSAGGNLMLSTAMRAASFNIRRPDGILGVYTPVLVRYTPSPARLLCLMDPLLPAGILSRCLAAYAGVSDDLSSQLAASVNCHIESSAATLRLSSQETPESDWVVVSQDAAASTSSTLAQSQQKKAQEVQRRERSSESLDEENGDEVEIFSRPRMTAASVMSTVTDARDKFVSYVGSYTQMLTKNFGAGGQTPDDVALQPMGASSSGSHVDEDFSSGDETSATYKSMPERANTLDDVNFASFDLSPCTPSFHTPLTSPCISKDALCPSVGPTVTAANNMAQVSEAASSEVMETDAAPESQSFGNGEPQGEGQTTAGDRSCCDVKGDLDIEKPGTDLPTVVNMSDDLPSALADGDVDVGSGHVDSEDQAEVDFPHLNSGNHNDDVLELQVGSSHAAVQSQNKGEITGRSPQELVPAGSAQYDLNRRSSSNSSHDKDSEKTRQSTSPIDLLPQDGSLAETNTSESCAVYASADVAMESEASHPQSLMPCLTEDNAELLQQELDNSVISGTDSVTLPSSLISTPSDDLNSYEVLGQGQAQQVVLHASADEVDGSQVMYKDAENVDKRIADSSPPGTEVSKSHDAALSPPSGHEATEQGDVISVREGAKKEAAVSEMSGPKIDRDQLPGMEEEVACLPPSGTTGNESSIDPLTGSDVTHFAEGLGLAQDFASHNNDMDRSGSSRSLSFASQSASSDSGTYLPVPSRSGLRLELRPSVSTSSMPRSTSLPVVTAFCDAAVSRSSHCMSPSDFKRERHLAQSPMHAIRNIPIAKNPYMSPLLAPDFLLEGLPHVCLVACHLDPLLDDSIMFTRRLRALGKSVDLLLIDDLPHGFLNFSLASKDAKHASDLCIAKLRKLLYPNDSLSA